MPTAPTATTTDMSVDARPTCTLAHMLATKGSANGVPSPCVNVCKMDDTRTLCLGCFRTLEELREWAKADDERRLAIWQLVEQRQAVP